MPATQLETDDTRDLVSEDLVKPFNNDPLNKEMTNTIDQMVDDNLSNDGLKVQPQ